MIDLRHQAIKHLWQRKPDARQNILARRHWAPERGKGVGHRTDNMRLAIHKRAIDIQNNQKRRQTLPHKIFKRIVFDIMRVPLKRIPRALHMFA